ncbi:MAG: hypothetical protein AB1425_00310 [Actinomycetota bacterium]
MIANEPRAYREILAETLRDLRPEVDFLLMEPGELAEAIPRLKPEIVICEEASAAVREGAPVSLEISFQQGPHAFLNFHGRRSRIENIQLSDILSIVDAAIGQRAPPP